MLLPALILPQCLKQRNFSAVETQSPPMVRNSVFRGYEDLRSPKVEALKSKYEIDTVFHGEEDEFKRQLLLRDWIRTIIPISDFESSYPGDGYPELILDASLKGQGYHCGHYMIVQNAVMNAYGYVTRCLGAGPGVAGGPDGHHGVNEVWSNTFGKWYLSDAKYNHHFEKNGIPLSALEIRDEFLRNQAADVVLAKGPQRIPVSSDSVADAAGEWVLRTPADFAQTYTWIAWESQNNRFTNWPENSDSLAVLNMYEDDFFRRHKWIWDGRPHWAYGTAFMKLVSDRKAIEWTPNTIASHVTVENGTARIVLTSETPNLGSYEMKKDPEDSWRQVPSSVDVDLKDDGAVILFRAVNLAGVAGPEHRVVLRRDP